MGGMIGGNAPRQFGYDGVSPLIDMINGGGAGRAGQRFEGGGLLSELGNALFRPYGFEERMGQVRPLARPMQAPMQPPMPPLTYGPQNPRRAPQPMQPSMGGGRTAVGPQRLPVPLTFEEFVAGLGPVAQTASPEALMTAYRQHMMGY